MADLGGHKNRIDRSQREFIIATFLDKGLDEAQRVASGVGLADNYAHKLLHGLGMIERAEPVVGQKLKAPRYIYQDGQWYVLKSHMINLVDRIVRENRKQCGLAQSSTRT